MVKTKPWFLFSLVGMIGAELLWAGSRTHEKIAFWMIAVFWLVGIATGYLLRAVTTFEPSAKPGRSGE